MNGPIRFSKGDIAKVAGNMLDFFDKKKVTSLAEIEAMAYHIFPLNGLENQISIAMYKSNLGTIGHRVSYETYSCELNGTEVRDIPLEIKFNEQLKYSKIFLKCTEDIPGYERFPQPDTMCPHGNIRQGKELAMSVPKVIEELEQLRDLDHEGYLYF